MAEFGLDYGQLLGNAARLLWQRRFLWGLGVLSVGGSGLSRAALRLLLRPVDLLSAEALPRALAAELPAGRLVVVATGAFLLFLFFWLLALWGEGGLIWAAGTGGDGQPLQAGAALRAGRRLLLPFVALDTLLFFPLFLLILVVMIGATLILVGLIWGVEGGAPVESALGGSLLAFLFCLLPLLCLAVPISILVFLFRILAFRVAALEGEGARASVRRAWGLLRRFPGSVLLAAMLLGGVGYAVSLLLGLLLLPLQGLLTIPGAVSLLAGEKPAPETLALPLLLTGLIALVEIGVRAMVHAFTSAGWTLTYQELARQDAQPQVVPASSRKAAGDQNPS